MVDDEKSYTDLMSQMLEENLERKVVSFTRPLDALSALPTLRPAVVVTDYFMPQINGIELMRLASAVTPETVFVLISGHNLDSVEDQLHRLKNLKGRLAKPFGWRKLADEILRVWPAHVPAPSKRADATSV
jgi:DNA-binding NtrC family response regulator